MRKLSFRTKYIIYGILLVCCIVWMVIGTRFVTEQSTGMHCFFALTLPFLGIFAMLAGLLHTAWRQWRAKSKSDSESEKKGEKHNK